MPTLNTMQDHPYRTRRRRRIATLAGYAIAQALLNKNFDHMPHLFLLQYLTEQAESDAANPPCCLVDDTANEMILRLLHP